MIFYPKTDIRIESSLHHFMKGGKVIWASCDIRYDAAAFRAFKDMREGGKVLWVGLNE